METVAERYLTVKDVADQLNLSEVAIRRLFLNEPGVLVIGRREGSTQAVYRYRREFRTERIAAGLEKEEIPERLLCSECAPNWLRLMLGAATPRLK